MVKRKCCDSNAGSDPHQEGCVHCKPPHQSEAYPHRAKTSDVTPDWTKKCEVCGASPVAPTTGMCGPCNFGEVDVVLEEW